MDVSQTNSSSNINEAPYLLHDKVINWSAEYQILDDQERIFATDYTSSGEVTKYQNEWAKVNSSLQYAALASVALLIISIIVNVVFLIVIFSISLFMELIFFAYLYSIKAKKLVIIFTSKRIIFIPTSFKNLEEFNSIETKGKDIRSLPWTAITRFKYFEKSVPLSGGEPVFGLKFYSEDYSNEMLIAIQDLNPFQFVKYVFGNNALYKYLEEPLPDKYAKKLSPELLDIAESIYDGNYELQSRSFHFTNNSGDSSLILDFDFTYPYKVEISTRNTDGSFNDTFHLFNPLLRLGLISKTKSFPIKYENREIYKMKNTEGWFLNLLLSYFFATLVPEELDVFYSYKSNIQLKKLDISSPVFSGYPLEKLDEKALKRSKKPKGVQSKRFHNYIHNSDDKGNILYFYPSPKESASRRKDKIVMATNWMHMNGFLFSYDDVANIVAYPKIHKASDEKTLYLRLRTPIIWTTSDGKSTQTHYKFGFKLDLPSQYAENMEDVFQEYFL